MSTRIAHEKARTHRSVALAGAEQLSTQDIQAATPLTDRPSWGKLEIAFESQLVPVHL